MKKVLAIYECGAGLDSSLHGIALDIEQGRKWIEEANKPHDEESKIQQMCSKCFGEDRVGSEKQPYKFRNTCPRASIKEDRNGEYCENELINSYDMTSVYYSGMETDIIG